MKYTVYKRKANNPFDKKVFVKNGLTNEEAIDLAKELSSIDRENIYWTKELKINSLVEYLENIYTVINFFGIGEDFVTMSNVLKSFGHSKWSDEEEVNILKTVLLATKGYIDVPLIKEERQRIKEEYEIVCGKLNAKPI